jgi:hypothetical protein
MGIINTQEEWIQVKRTVKGKNATGSINTVWPAYLPIQTTSQSLLSHHASMKKQDLFGIRRKAKPQQTLIDQFIQPRE